MINVKNLSKSYGNISILKNISLEIAPTEFVSLVGPSGAGKSFLVSAIAEKACRSGFSARYYRSHNLLTEVCSIYDGGNF